MTLPRTERYRLCAARGMSVNEVARLYDVTPHAIRLANRTHKLGFKVKKTPRDRNLEIMRKRVEALRDEGKNRREISVELGVPYDTVCRWYSLWKVRFPEWRGIRKPMLKMIAERITDAERDDLLLLKRKGYTYRDAFVAMRRPDLLEYLP